MRHVGSDPQAERGRGEVNLSPIEVLTLRPRVGGFYMCWKVLGSKINRILRVWKVPGGSMCRILRAWKLKTSIHLKHLLGFGMEGSGRQNGRLWGAKCVVLYASGSSKPRKIHHICLVFGRKRSLSPIPIRGFSAVLGPS